MESGPWDAGMHRLTKQRERRLPEGAAARRMDFEADIVEYELVLVMDKFTAADVLREVSVYETINKAARYTSKVRQAALPKNCLRNTRLPCAWSHP